MNGTHILASGQRELHWPNDLCMCAVFTGTVNKQNVIRRQCRHPDYKQPSTNWTGMVAVSVCQRLSPCCLLLLRLLLSVPVRCHSRVPFAYVSPDTVCMWCVIFAILMSAQRLGNAVAVISSGGRSTLILKVKVLIPQRGNISATSKIPALKMLLK